jgi:hypothetical protein
MHIYSSRHLVTIITTEEIKEHLIPNVRNFNFEKMIVTSTKIVTKNGLDNGVEIKIFIKSVRDLLDYLNDYYLDKFDIFYCYESEIYIP